MDVMSASVTCRKWRMVAHINLLRLCFRGADWRRARSKDVNTRSLEVGITQTLMRMSSLYQLYAGFLGEKHKFSAATILWQSMTEFFKCIQAA
jgi:hypothetical protein